MPATQESAQTVGEKLRLRREERSLSLEEAAFSTRIRIRYLRWLEEGIWNELPSIAQGKGFLRTYAGFLGLDPSPLLALLSSEESSQPTSASEPVPDPNPPTPAALERAAAAGVIFGELGQTLRKQREQLGLSLEDVERHTHLRIHYLQAMEIGDFDKLPSPVQGRGMLSNFANFLGMNTDMVLLRYAEGLQSQLMARREVMNPPSKPRKSDAPKDGEENKTTERSRIFLRLLSKDVIIAGVLILFLISFIAWGGMRILSVRAGLAAQTPVSTAPSIADVLLREPGGTGEPELTPEVQLTPTTGITLTAIAPNPIITDLSAATEVPEGTQGEETEAVGEPAEGTEQPAAVSVELDIVVRQRVWFRLIADGEVVFDDRAVPNSAYQFDASEQVEIITGNGAALQVFYNGRDLGLLGDVGEVIHLVFTVEGYQKPAPQSTPTGGPTQRPTMAPTSPLPTATATNTGN
ncbi:MAG: DUF4115 domain-containing protein [Chloroflexi bacterium]|nr:MAG: DUF4115 domain-containing protein [Chloroflexota bacterium]